MKKVTLLNWKEEDAGRGGGSDRGGKGGLCLYPNPVISQRGNEATQTLSAFRLILTDNQPVLGRTDGSAHYPAGSFIQGAWKRLSASLPHAIAPFSS